jgi:chromosome condensin MukBEF complex kleisin-like MukF subunit
LKKFLLLLAILSNIVLGGLLSEGELTDIGIAISTGIDSGRMVIWLLIK